MEISTFTGAVSTLLAGVPGAYDYSQPAVSPDGSKIAVTDTIPTTPRQSTIDVLSAAGGAPTPVTSVTTAGQLDSAPDWSPDGSMLVYSHQTPAGVVLDEIASGGGTPTTIPNNGDSWTDPGFSPDGTDLVATSHLTSVDIWTLNASGPLSQLTNIDGAERMIELLIGRAPVRGRAQRTSADGTGCISPGTPGASETRLSLPAKIFGHGDASYMLELLPRPPVGG